MIDTSKTPYVLPVLFEEGDPNVRYREFVDYPGYVIGDDGSVWNCRKPRGAGTPESPRFYEYRPPYKRMSPTVGKYGHCNLLLAGLEKKRRSIHRLVLFAFVGAPPTTKHEACHGDGNATNNSLANLRWDTKRANTIDKFRHGSIASGDSTWNAVLNEEKVLEIRRRYADGDLQKDLANEFGVSRPCVSAIVSRRTWQSVGGVYSSYTKEKRQRAAKMGNAWHFTRTPELLDRLKQLMDSGVSDKQIKETLNISRYVLSQAKADLKYSNN